MLKTKQQTLASTYSTLSARHTSRTENHSPCSAGVSVLLSVIQEGQ